MTVTYDVTNSIGQIRLMIGDNIIANPVFTDEEIQVFLTLNDNSLKLAAAAALDSWAAQYAANADSEHIGDYSYTQKVVSNMTQLAQKYRDDEANTPACDWAEMDLVTYGDEDDV